MVFVMLYEGGNFLLQVIDTTITAMMCFNINFDQYHLVILSNINQKQKNKNKNEKNNSVSIHTHIYVV